MIAHSWGDSGAGVVVEPLPDSLLDNYPNRKTALALRLSLDRKSVV